MIITIDSYLTERKLATALQAILGEKWAGGQVMLPGSRKRFDMAYRTDSDIVLVEYDGDDHYRDSMKIKADQQKDILATENHMHLVRIPYWVQLDAEMAQFWFGLKVDIEQSFPHGFISTRLFPASFCELGVARFQRELEGLPGTVRRAVIASLRERAVEHGLEYVLPSQLRALID